MYAAVDHAVKYSHVLGPGIWAGRAEYEYSIGGMSAQGNVTAGEEWADGMSQRGRSGRTECHSGGGAGGRNVTVGEEWADGMSQWGRSGRTECHSGG